jgi:hypothetical protein
MNTPGALPGTGTERAIATKQITGQNCAPNGTTASLIGGGFQVTGSAAGTEPGSIGSIAGSGVLGGIPTWVYLAGGAALLVFLFMQQGS